MFSWNTKKNIKDFSNVQLVISKILFHSTHQYNSPRGANDKRKIAKGASWARRWASNRPGNLSTIPVDRAEGVTGCGLGHAGWHIRRGRRSAKKWSTSRPEWYPESAVQSSWAPRGSTIYREIAENVMKWNLFICKFVKNILDNSIPYI